MIAATLLVAVFPIWAAWEVRAIGLIPSVIVSGAFGTALAFGVSYVGGWIWSARPGSGDLLFSELMLWGWLRRLWVERRLDNAVRLLEDVDGDAELDHERRGELLAQLAVTLEARDPYTHGHSHRVARHAATIAKRMGLSRHEVADIRAAAMVHDVGKLSTPNTVLRKAGRLSDAEFDVIKEHAVQGAEMVSKLRNDRVTAMVLHHHERLDGSGYPDGLVGSAIPLGARIIAVADTFDAITSTRPYRRARSHRAAIEILHEQAGTRLDPAAVRAFESHYSGRRTLALWVAFSNVPGRLISWLGSGATAAAGPVARAMATAAVTGAAAVTAVAGSQTHLGIIGGGPSRHSSDELAAHPTAASAAGGPEFVSNTASSGGGATVFALYNSAQGGLFGGTQQKVFPTTSLDAALIGIPGVPMIGLPDLVPAGAGQRGSLELAGGTTRGGDGGLIAGGLGGRGTGAVVGGVETTAPAGTPQTTTGTTSSDSSSTVSGDAVTANSTDQTQSSGSSGTQSSSGSTDSSSGGQTDTPINSQPTDTSQTTPIGDAVTQTPPADPPPDPGPPIIAPAPDPGATTTDPGTTTTDPGTTTTDPGTTTTTVPGPTTTDPGTTTTTTDPGTTTTTDSSSTTTTTDSSSTTTTTDSSSTTTTTSSSSTTTTTDSSSTTTTDSGSTTTTDPATTTTDPATTTTDPGPATTDPGTTATDPSSTPTSDPSATSSDPSAGQPTDPSQTSSDSAPATDAQAAGNASTTGS